MKIFIDADGCPVVDLCIKIACEFGLEVVIICDYCHLIEYNNSLVQVITVDKGADSVDFVLVNKISSTDIVVTQDYGLAAMCLGKGACVINQNGLIYTNENIDSLLLSRHINKKIRRAGGKTANMKKRTKEQDNSFEVKLTYLLKTRVDK